MVGEPVGFGQQFRSGLGHGVAPAREWAAYGGGAWRGGYRQTRLRVALRIRALEGRQRPHAGAVGVVAHLLDAEVDAVGLARTGVAARMEGRSFIGYEVDERTAHAANARVERMRA